jgi:amino acid adenylation domain-containing protein
MNEWNATETADAAVCCVHELFEQQANSTPDALAVIAEDRTLTYRQLDEEAGALALRLRDLGVGPEARVGVVLERSARAVVAVLGVLKAGGAFVPLDPACPTQRLQLMLEDTKPLALLSETCFARRLDDSRNLVMLDALDELRPSAGKRPVAEAAVEPTNLAYVMYTSGSTGKPKGVMVEHRSLCNQLAWRQAVFPLTPADAVLHATPLSFDPSVWEILGPLTCGARVIVLPCGAHDGPRVRRAILEHGVTTMQAVPSILRALLDQEAFAGCGGRLKRVFCGGEVLDSSLQERLRGAVSAELVVLYGCTETAIDATYHRCGREPMPGIIGRPIANTRAYVLDESMRPVPIGVPGLLYVAGAGVARGYLGDAELTRESFVADPHVDDEAERAYCTGDLARWLPGGQLEFLGRADRQLKLRGLRIEPAEIEAALRSHPAVQDAAVGVRHDRAANARLVAWLVSRSGAAADEAALRAFLAEKLPDYMLPSHYVPMDALPSTPSGKLDAARLPDPPACDRPYVAPRTPLEGQLARLWEELLGLPQVGVTDGFFDLGGHSLLAVRLASRMSRVLGRQILCQDLFAKPTIEALVGAHTQAAPHAPRVPLDA